MTSHSSRLLEEIATLRIHPFSHMDDLIPLFALIYDSLSRYPAEQNLQNSCSQLDSIGSRASGNPLRANISSVFNLDNAEHSDLVSCFQFKLYDVYFTSSMCNAKRGYLSLKAIGSTFTEAILIGQLRRLPKK